jgi:hypothetical protein
MARMEDRLRHIEKRLTEMEERIRVLQLVQWMLPWIIGAFIAWAFLPH